MTELLQDNRLLRISTPLGDDAVVPVSMVGEEGVSRPFLFTVDLVSTEPAADVMDLLGRPVTLHIAPPDGKERLVHGLVRRVLTVGRDKRAGYVRYQIEVVPALWFLSLSTNCRTFENKSVLDIVEEVCKGGHVSDLDPRVASTPPVVPYVVQYQETDLAFVHRLLEGAGIYYTFDHTEDKHTLVLSDAHDSAIPACDIESIRVQPTFEDAAPQTDVVFRVSQEHAVHAASVSLIDHDLLRSDDKGDISTTSKGARGERYAFLGDLGPKDSAAEAKRRMKQEEAGYDQYRGASTCAAFRPGTRVEMTDWPDDGASVPLHLLSVTHRVQGADIFAGSGLKASYENEFLAIPAPVPHLPERVTLRPSVRGTQTATIVGTGGTGEIDVDEDGRILLQFPWDRGVGSDGKSKHRVHVASAWSGTGWGFVQIPRIGQEVLVEFMEGDPDRPIVTGRVYNHTHKFPYALPGDKTQTGWKSRTLGGGDENFNELRFEDKKGEEHIFSQAEKDLKILVKHDETRDVKHDRTTTVTNDDTRTVTDGNDTHTVKKGNQTVTVEKGDQTVEVKTGKQTVKVMDDQTITVDQGNRAVTLKMGNDELKVEMGNLTTKVAMGNISMKADLGKISIEAMQEISLKVGASSVVLSQTGVTIKGLMIKAEATTQAEVKGLMTKVEGSAMVQVKGAIAQVNGDGLLMAKGGITMIN
ncbi:MAG TPA: type VI secretion system tip protein TssI/VgrG [Gemmatimonadaceae bacterium]|jgi:type VI secretion system secreted protein VgrG|nr:type VI secretion system tip protein TssI/VgrG [Gemmatimonadaceae bacterium]